MLGAFLGLVLSLKLLRMSTVRNQRDYEVNRPTCYSCARCCPTCPSDELHEINFVDQTGLPADRTQIPPPEQSVASRG